jgi:hypothetical protein
MVDAIPTDVQERDGEAAQPGYRAGIADGNLAQSMELDDFLHGLAVVLRLPPKRTRQAAHVLLEGPPERRRTGRWAYAALGVLAVGISATFWRPAPDVPAALRGTWVTDDPKYSARALEFDTRLVKITTGEQPADVATYRVTRVAREATSSGTSFTIRYDSDGAPVELNVIVSTDPRPSLRLRNQRDIIWHRQAT